MPSPFTPFGLPVPGYNPVNWYWEVAGIAGFVFSSQRAAWVSTTDATYVAWLGNPWAPTVVPDVGTLVSILTSAGLTAASVAAVADPTNIVAVRAVYLAQVAATRYALVAGGVTINGHPFTTDLESRANWDSVYLSALGNTAMTIQWKLSTGVFLLLTAAQILAAGQALLAFVQSCFTYEQSLVTQINAAANFAAVQALPLTTGWPSNVLTVAGGP
jgi:hypothetical protein